jgi:hypothetical protein
MHINESDKRILGCDDDVDPENIQHVDLLAHLTKGQHKRVLVYGMVEEYKDWSMQKLVDKVVEHFPDEDNKARAELWLLVCGGLQVGLKQGIGCYGSGRCLKKTGSSWVSRG